MQILKTKGWQDYALLDSGEGFRLERFGQYVISRPDPQVIWKKSQDPVLWDKADAKFENDQWNVAANFPHEWLLSYKNLKFYAKLTPFKHTGIFPEQSLNWDFVEKILRKVHDKTQTKVLNLFGYTGIASLVFCAANGAEVTHVDASKPSIGWAKENQEASGLVDKPIRWILDDAIDFTSREIRRGAYYDGIIMDPPVYGHGPNGKIWDFDKSFPLLLKNCSQAFIKESRCL